MSEVGGGSQTVQRRRRVRGHQRDLGFLSSTIRVGRRRQALALVRRGVRPGRGQARRYEASG